MGGDSSHAAPPVACCEMFSSTPAENMVIRSAEPPKEMNGSGSPLVGSAPMTTPRFTSVWVASISGEPEREVAAEGIRRAQADAQPPPDEQREERDDADGADQPQLLADDGEDEVGVGLGQVEELLLRLPEPAAEPATRAEREERLDDLEAAALRVVPRVDEGDHAPPPVRLHRDQRAPPRAARAGATARHVLTPGAREIGERRGSASPARGYCPGRAGAR